MSLVPHNLLEQTEYYVWRLKSSVNFFILFNITNIRSDDTLKTTSESFAAFNNVVPAHGHPFSVDEGSDGGNVRVTNIARLGHNMRAEGITQWVGV